MEKADKAKAILVVIEDKVNVARDNWYDAKTAEAEAQARLSVEKERVTNEDFGGGFGYGKVPQFTELLKLKQETVAQRFKIYQDWKEVYEYTLDTFLLKIQ